MYLETLRFFFLSLLGYLLPAGHISFIFYFHTTYITVIRGKQERSRSYDPHFTPRVTKLSRVCI